MDGLMASGGLHAISRFKRLIIAGLKNGSGSNGCSTCPTTAFGGRFISAHISFPAGGLPNYGHFCPVAAIAFPFFI